MKTYLLTGNTTGYPKEVKCDVNQSAISKH